ncbi:MAG TPA: hypothetical protein VFW07_25615 [Parafilimonas sp.]|nr:hypothetical protein [Parafilimonas sp.]
MKAIAICFITLISVSPRTAKGQIFCNSLKNDTIRLVKGFLIINNQYHDTCYSIAKDTVYNVISLDDVTWNVEVRSGRYKKIYTNLRCTLAKVGQEINKNNIIGFLSKKDESYVYVNEIICSDSDGHIELKFDATP